MNDGARIKRLAQELAELIERNGRKFAVVELRDANDPDKVASLTICAVGEPHISLLRPIIDAVAEAATKRGRDHVVDIDPRLKQ